MKTGKLLEKLKDILSSERQAQLTRYKSLKRVLKSLRSKKVKLEKEFEHTKAEEARTDILNRLRIVSEQRKKGLQVLKDLRQERRQNEERGNGND